MSSEEPRPEMPGGAEPGRQPSEEELRAAYEAELEGMHTTDMLMQAAVTLVNLGARRLAPHATDTPAASGSASASAGAAAGGRDLEQARDAIDAVKALLEILQRTIPPQQLRPLRDALSQLQMAYAREVQTAGASAAEQAPAQQGPTPAQAPTAGQSSTAGQAPTSGQPPTPGEPDKGAHQPGPAEASGRLWVPGR